MCDIVSFIGDLNIFPLISMCDIVSINKLTDTKKYLSVWSHMTALVKIKTSVLKVSTDSLRY
jgi:hypothetical protein